MTPKNRFILDGLHRSQAPLEKVVDAIGYWSKVWDIAAENGITAESAPVAAGYRSRLEPFREDQPSRPEPVKPTVSASPAVDARAALVADVAHWEGMQELRPGDAGVASCLTTARRRLEEHDAQKISQP